MSTSSSTTGSPRTTSTTGCTRPACCAATAAASTSPSRTGASWACAAARTTGSTTAGSGPRVCTAGEANASRPAHAPLVRAAAGSVEATGTRRWAGSSRTSRRPAGRERAAVARLLHLRAAVASRTTTRSRVIGKAGIGTPHMDGNTRLCTATAAAALKESLRRRRPARLVCRHRPLRRAVPATGTTSPRRRPSCGARMLDRLAGADPPNWSSSTRGAPPSAERADVHLALKPGTNLALMNGLIHELIHRGWVDEAYVAAHTVGFEELARGGRRRTTPPGSAEICGVPARDVEAAAEIFGTAERLLSTVLQGFYQSHQATAAAVAGQQPAPAPRHDRPSRARAPPDERPAHGPEQPRGRRRRRPARLPQLGEPRARPAAGATSGTSTPTTIPHWAPPTHVMQIFRYAEQGSIGSSGSPAPTRPSPCPTWPASARSSPRTRCSSSSRTPSRPRRPSWPTSSCPRPSGARSRDVHQRRPHRAPLRAGGRAPRRGAQRPRHLPRLRPPDGLPRQGRPAAIPWADAEGAFEAWRECSRGRPCDYSGLTYDLLRGGGGIQWPVHRRAPRRHRTSLHRRRVPHRARLLRDYGHDLTPAAPSPPSSTGQRARRPGASSRPRRYVPPPRARRTTTRSG